MSTGNRKGADHSLAALKSIRAVHPDGAQIYVILDSFSSHKGSRIRRWAARNKVELCFTPTNASWANPIEAHFGPLRRSTLADSSHPNHTVQTRALHLHLHWRNQKARHQGVLAAQRRERAPLRSEKGHPLGRPPSQPRGLSAAP
ncbi:transposase [Streptomyces sp. NBC_00287]